MTRKVRNCPKKSIKTSYFTELETYTITVNFENFIKYALYDLIT